MLHALDDLAAHTVDVGNFRVLPDEDALVDNGSQLFDEVRVDEGRDGAQRLVEQDFYIRIRGSCKSRGALPE